MNGRDPELALFLEDVQADSKQTSTVERIVLFRQRLRRLATRSVPQSDQLRRVLDSEDLANETLYGIVQAIPSFRGNTWGEFLQFAESLLRRQVVNHARRLHASRRDVGREGSLDSAETADPECPTPSALCQRGEDRLRVARLVDGLPEPFRAVVRLRLEGLDYEDVADRLGISSVTARQRMSRALALLKARW